MKNPAKLRRRTLLPAPLVAAPLLSLPILGQQHHHPASNGKQPWVNYQPRALSAEHYRALETFCDELLPDEPASPGARTVGAPYYIDTLVYHAARTGPSGAQVQQQWVEGLSALEAESRRRFGKGFAAATPRQRVTLLTALAASERSPQTPAERFFAMAKQLVITAWAHSEAGMQQGLGYRGNQFRDTFPACDLGD